jgi:preprotein translocase subunit SecE
MDELDTQDEPVEFVEAPRGGKLALVVDYVRSARREMDKVTWPTQEELTTSTRLVVIGALGLGVIIGVLDFVLQKILVSGIATLGQ